MIAMEKSVSHRAAFPPVRTPLERTGQSGLPCMILRAAPENVTYTLLLRGQIDLGFEEVRAIVNGI